MNLLKKLFGGKSKKQEELLLTVRADDGQALKIENGRIDFTERALTKEDFEALAKQLGIVPGFAVKLGDKPVAAMNIVDREQSVTTINTKDGSIQATKTAKPGDAIMTRLNKDGTVKLGVTGQPDQWVVDADLLEKLYNKLGDSNEYGSVVGGNNEVLFISLPNGGSIVAPWGGPQQTSDGVLQYSLTTGEVYLNEEDGFKTFNVQKQIAAMPSSEKQIAEKYWSKPAK